MGCLSVIVPAYNRANLIGLTLRSLLVQTLPADEIIVVDDGSMDNTAEVAESFGLPVKVIRRQNGGPAAARNTGFANSNGQFIHFFDSDDLAAPNKLETQVNALERTGADIAIGPWIQGKFSGSSFLASNNVLQQRGLPKGLSLIKALLTHWSFMPHSAMFRRSIVEKSGGFDESLFVAEDQLMFLNCLLAGAKVVHTPETIEFYRVGDASKITENEEWSVRKWHEWACFLVKSREACLKKGIEPLHWFGYRRRLWEVEQDMRYANYKDATLMSGLRALIASGTHKSFYRWHRQIERWLGGLQQRLTGGRAHCSFRIGKITPEQIVQLEKLGYRYEPPKRLPWHPQKDVRSDHALADS